MFKKICDRFKNPLVVGHLIMSLILTCLSYFDLRPQDVTSFDILFKLIKDTFNNPYVLGNMLWLCWCILFDPNHQSVNTMDGGFKIANKRKFNKI